MAITKKTNLWPSWRRAPEEPPVEVTEPAPVKSTAATAAATPAATSPAPPPSTPRQIVPEIVPETVRDFAPEIAPEYTLDLIPVTILTNGQSAMVATGWGNREWTNQDFAREFLSWIAREYPECAGRNISACDIEVHFLPRFKANTGRENLVLGSLLRRLAKVTRKQVRTYTDWTGLPREIVEYWVPRLRRKGSSRGRASSS